MKIPVAVHKSLGFLANPLSLAAVALILLNDWVLRGWLPGWLTGKLSDLGALWVAPGLVALVLAVLLWPWLGRRSRLAGGLAYGLVLAGFLLLKLASASNVWLVGLFASAGLPIRAIADPTDLLCLPALGLSAWLWFRPSSASQPGAMSLSWRVLLVPLAALVLMADAAAPDFGVDCLALKDKTIQAYAGYGAMYASQDGGKTWTALENSAPPGQCQPKNIGTVLDLTATGGGRYRVTLGQRVEFAASGGQWRTPYQAQSLSEAEQTFLIKTRAGNLYYRPGPLDALVDPATGNLVLAMGQEGVLLVPPSGAPVWVTVASYRHDELRQSGAAGLATLLALEFWLGLGAALIWFSTVSLRHRRAVWQVVLTIIGWVLLALAALAAYPGISASSEVAIISYTLLLAALAWALVLAIIALVRHWRTALKRFLLTLIILPVVWALFLVPYLLWGLLVLPQYWVAAALAGLVLLAASIVGYSLRKAS